MKRKQLRGGTMTPLAILKTDTGYSLLGVDGIIHEEKISAALSNPEGHNQYTVGIKGSHMSGEAWKATEQANKTGSKEDHRRAAALHGAAVMHMSKLKEPRIGEHTARERHFSRIKAHVQQHQEHTKAAED